jgi:spoIIIJ-associated protein
MKSIEVSAKTVEEAIEIALKELGMSRSEVQIEVLKESKPGILGLGSGEAKVRITPLRDISEGREEVAPIAKEVLEELLALMDVQASVSLREERGNGESVILDVTGENLGILIGRRGETLSSLQYMVNLIVSRKLKSRSRITVDVAEYQRRRSRTLRLLALRSAELVKSLRRSITLEPMPSKERRIIHRTLRDDPEVTTQSIGEGERRRVTISLRRKI